MLGGEPIVTATGDRLVDEKGRPVLCDERRAPGLRSQSTSCSPTCRPRTPSKGTSLAVEYLGETLPGDRRRGRRDPLVRSRTTRE